MNNNSNNSIKSRLKKARKDGGYTQQSFADELGLQLKTYAKYEQETSCTYPPLEVFIDIVKTLNISADYLLLDTQTATNKRITELISKCPKEKLENLLIIVSTFINSF